MKLQQLYRTALSASCPYVFKCNNTFKLKARREERCFYCLGNSAIRWMTTTHLGCQYCVSLNGGEKSSMSETDWFYAARCKNPRGAETEERRGEVQEGSSKTKRKNEEKPCGHWRQVSLCLRLRMLEGLHASSSASERGRVIGIKRARGFEACLIFVSAKRFPIFLPWKYKKLWKWHKTSTTSFLFITATFLDQYGFIWIKSQSNCDEGWFRWTASLSLLMSAACYD